MALNQQVWQGHYGEAFVCVLARAAGLTVAQKNPDVDGVDMQFGYPGRLGTIRYPAIEAQVKSWSNPKANDSHFRYSLPLKNYDELVGKVGVDFPLPRYLFLVITPPDHRDYTSAYSEFLRANHAAYWVSLMDETPAEELSVTTEKTVYVPRVNLLSAEQLLALLSL